MRRERGTVIGTAVLEMGLSLVGVVRLIVFTQAAILSLSYNQRITTNIIVNKYSELFETCINIIH